MKQAAEIFIFFTTFDKHSWELAQRCGCLNVLPPAMQIRNSRYLRWEDRAANLLGKLLLLWGLRHLGLDNIYNLEDVKYTRYNRPYIVPDIDFSISHSGSYVIISIGRSLKTGIDIEEIKHVSVEDFSQVLFPGEIENIKTSEAPLEKFFSIWTLKESVIKADGRGFMAPIKQVICADGFAELDNVKWHFSQLEVDPAYRLCVATDKPGINRSIGRINVQDLIHHSVKY